MAKGYKICLVSRSTTFHSQSGGMETHLKNLARGLAERGNLVWVVSSSLGDKNELIEDGVNYIFLKDVPSDRYTAEFFNLSREYLLMLEHSSGLEVVLGESLGAYGFATDKTRSTPVIEIAHGSLKAEVLTVWENLNNCKDYFYFGLKVLPYAVKSFIRDRKSAKVDDAQICVSQEVASDVINDLGIDPNKVSVIYNGIDPKIFEFQAKSRIEIREKYHLDKDDFVILCLGRIIPEKGFQDVIAVLKNLDTKWRLLIIGDGPYLSSLKHLSKEIGVEDRVRFNGAWVDYQETPKYYSAADLYILPTHRREGFPMTTIEAQMCGLPVIVANKGGSKEAVLPGKTGFVYQSGNQLELADILKELANKELLTEMSKAAHTHALNNFSIDKMVDETLKVIAKVIQEEK